MSMGAMVLLRGGATAFRHGSFSRVVLQRAIGTRKHFSVNASLESPDVANLARTARISLTPDEVEEFAPKLQQVVDWFGQLQAVDLESVEPSIHADTQGFNSREDLPENFENRQAILDGIPSFDEPYIKVPKVLNKE